MACRVSCCPYLRSGCIHHNWICGDCTSGTVTRDDRALYDYVKSQYMRQSPLYRFFFHFPACWPCFLLSACASCMCENNSMSNYDAAKLDQGHRFDECVCFNTVMNFTMALDPNYKHPFPQSGGSPVINIVNQNVNNVRTGDVNLSNVGNASNSNSTNTGGGNSSSASTGVASPTTVTKEDIKKLRIEKAIKEERYSDAERIMNS